jgi:hypothetical protein
LKFKKPSEIDRSEKPQVKRGKRKATICGEFFCCDAENIIENRKESVC